MRVVLLLLFFMSVAENFYEFTLKMADGSEINFNQFQNKVVLIVNTATRCGFAYQISELQKLHEAYRDRGLIVLAIPTNDFAKQEPLVGKDLVEYCSKNHGVDYLIADRASIKDPIFKFLTSNSDSFPQRVLWNFEKFLIDKKGKVRYRFRSRTSPLDQEFKATIEKLLNE